MASSLEGLRLMTMWGTGVVWPFRAAALAIAFAPLLAALPYAAVMTAAIVEGEVAYLGAATLVAHGRLNPVAVLAAGAVGAALGDQAWFYLFRYRLAHWFQRSPSLARKAAPLFEHVHRHEALMVLAIRFAPGLRVALAAACACVNVAPLKFTVLNLASAFMWAGSLLLAVSWFGPVYLAQFGLGGWKGAVVVASVVFCGIKVVAAYERRLVSRSEHV